MAARPLGLLLAALSAALRLPAETDAEIKVQMKQDPVNILVHEDVALQCLLSGYNNNLQSEKLGVLWKFGEDTIFSYSAGKIVNNWNNTEIYEKDILHKNMTLVLRNTTFNHEGNYKCEVLIEPEHRISGITSLFVSARPFVAVTSHVSVEVGREASLVCDVNGYFDSSILIEWIQINKEKLKSITSNVCRVPPRANPNGTYSASVQIMVEPAIDDIGTQYACRVKHRSFPQDHIEHARYIVKEQTSDATLETIFGIVSGFILLFLIATISVFSYLTFLRPVPPKVSQIKALTHIIHKEMAKLKVDVSGFRNCVIQITWSVTWSSPCVTRTIIHKLDRKPHYFICKRTPQADTSFGAEHWKAELSSITKNSDGTYNVSSELIFEPDIDRDDGTEIICDVSQEDDTSPVSKRMTLNVEGVPPKVAGIISPPLVLHNAPVSLTCPIHYFKPRNITISWHKKGRGKTEEEDLDVELFSFKGPDSRHNGRYTHGISQMEFEDQTHSVNSVLLFKPTIGEDDGAEYICRIDHLALREPLKVIVPLEIKACPVMEPISCEPSKPEAEKSLMLISRIHSFYPELIRITWWENDNLLPMCGMKTHHERQTDMNVNSLPVIWSHYTLSLTLADRGKRLVCRVEHESLSQPMESEYIFHEIAMAPKVGTIQCQPAVPEPGKELTLSCEIKGYVPREIQVEWYKCTTRIDKQHVINKDRSIFDVFDMTSEVTFTPTIEDHQMEFRLEVCHSTISKQPTARRFILQFSGFPLFSAFMLDPPQPQYGRQLALKCVVNGLNGEDFAVSWIRNGKHLTDGIRNDGPVFTSGGYKMESVLHFIVTAEDFEKEIIFQLWSNWTKENYKNRIILPLQAMSPWVSEITCSKDCPRPGERVTLLCSATEFSPRDIRILWNRGWFEFSSSDSTEKLTLEENGLYRLDTELVVASLGPEEAEYLCEVYHQQTSTFEQRKYAIKYS